MVSEFNLTKKVMICFVQNGYDLSVEIGYDFVVPNGSDLYVQKG